MDAQAYANKELITVTDYCPSNDHLVEYYCINNVVDDDHYLNCPNGCKDGACIVPTSGGGGGSGVGVTYQGVLEMLNNCNMLTKYEGELKTCDEVCRNRGYICIFGINSKGGYTSGQDYLDSCNAGWYKEDFTRCMCCSLP